MNLAHACNRRGRIVVLAVLLVCSSVAVILEAFFSWKPEHTLTSMEMQNLRGGILHRICDPIPECNLTGNCSDDYPHQTECLDADAREYSDVGDTADACTFDCGLCGIECSVSENVHLCNREFKCKWNATFAFCYRGDYVDEHWGPNACYMN